MKTITISLIFWIVLIALKVSGQNAMSYWAIWGYTSIAVLVEILIGWLTSERLIKSAKIRFYLWQTKRQIEWETKKADNAKAEQEKQNERAPGY